MRSFSAAPANFHYTARIHPALLGFAGDVCGFLAPLSAYLMTLALLAIGAWEHLLDATATEPSDKGGWSLADRSARAFAVSQFDLHDKTETYEVLRHPGGRPQGPAPLARCRQETGCRTRDLPTGRRIHPARPGDR